MNLALNIVAPEKQSEDFSDLEIHIACRHLRNSRINLPVHLVNHATRPQFNLKRTLVEVGDIIETYSLSEDNPTDLTIVGPEWIKCAIVEDLEERDDTSTTSSEKSTACLVRAKCKSGNSLKIEKCEGSGSLTIYNSREPFEKLQVRIESSHVAFPPLKNTSLWRDAVELELVRACVLHEFSCPPKILFQEIVQIITRDPGGRGASLISLFFRVSLRHESEAEDRSLCLKFLKSLPESYLMNINDYL